MSVRTRTFLSLLTFMAVFGFVASIESHTAPALGAGAGDSRISGGFPFSYEVRKNDTLEGIRSRFWGTSGSIETLAIRNGLTPPYLLEPGMTLVIFDPLADLRLHQARRTFFDPRLPEGQADAPTAVVDKMPGIPVTLSESSFARGFRGEIEASPGLQLLRDLIAPFLFVYSHRIESLARHLMAPVSTADSSGEINPANAAAAPRDTAEPSTSVETGTDTSGTTPAETMTQTTAGVSGESSIAADIPAALEPATGEAVAGYPGQRTGISVEASIAAADQKIPVPLKGKPAASSEESLRTEAVPLSDEASGTEVVASSDIPVGTTEETGVKAAQSKAEQDEAARKMVSKRRKLKIIIVLFLLLVLLYWLFALRDNFKSDRRRRRGDTKF